MWIEKRKNSFRMYERYSDPITGEHHKVSVKFDKNTPQQRNKAKEKLDKLVAQHQTFRFDVSFKVLTDVYLASKQKEVKPSTHRRNVAECKRLLKILGNIDVDNFTAGYVKAKLMKYNPKPSTVNEHIQRFKEIIKWGYQNDYVERIDWLDKLTKIKDASRHEKVKDKYLEKDECNLLLADISNTAYYLTKFLLLSGLRCGEALALKDGDLDFENSVISVSKTKDAISGEIQSPKTSASVRQVPMQDDLYDLCKEILEYRDNNLHDKEGFLFYNRYGEPMEYASYNKTLKEHSENVLGRRITTHYLRHTHASLLAAEKSSENNIDFELIQRRLGHENSTVTKQIYIHVTDSLKDKDKDAVKRIKLL